MFKKVLKREEEGEDVEFNTSKRVERSTFISDKSGVYFHFKLNECKFLKLMRID